MGWVATVTTHERRDASERRVTLLAMAHVYGDSTAFPYDLDYIELSRHAVDCAVQLFSAQHAIAASLERVGSLNQARASELSRITAMSQAVESSLSQFLGSGSPETERIARRKVARF